MKTLILLLSLSSIALPCRAGVVHSSLTDKGLVVDMGDTGTFNLSGPVVHFKDATTGKDVSIKPVFTPGPDGLSGSISYPGSPGDFKMNLTISPADDSIHFNYDQLPPSLQTIQFSAQFDGGQFRGGRYALNGQPLTDIPLDLLKPESMHTGQLDLLGRDGVGISLKAPMGYAGFGDDRKWNPDTGQTYSWNYMYRPDPSTDATGFAITVQDLKAPVTNPPALLPPGPPPGAKWVPIPELTDDFQGSSLDTTKWWDHNPGWAGRSPSYFSPNNVKVSNGLQILARLQDPPPALKAWPSFKNFSTACVVSKATTLYGYYEVKAKVMDLNVDSAFWFYTQLPNPPSNKHVEEMDVFEINGGGKKYERTIFDTMHVWQTPDPTPKTPWAKSVAWRAPARLADDYHIYSMDWEKDEIKCYFDGYLYAKYANTNWHYPLPVLFDVEIQPQWFGMVPPDKFNGVFNIQYIHSWRKADDATAAVTTGP